MPRNGYEGLEEHVIVGPQSISLEKEPVITRTTWTPVTQQRIIFDQGVAYYEDQSPSVEGQLIVKYESVSAEQGGTQLFATMYCAILMDDGTENGKLEWQTVQFRDKVVDNNTGDAVS